MIKKAAYSLGAVATALSYQSFSTYIVFFYVDVIKLNAGPVALAMLVFGIWNAINDPIAGYVSDRTITPWGRRIPYIAAGAVPFGLVYFLLWTPPTAAGTLWLLIYFLLIICLFDLVYTVVILNWAALFPEMFPSLSERAEVNSFRQTFGMLGLILGVALPPLLYSTLGWGKMGLIFGSTITLVMLVTLLGSGEKKEFRRGRPLGIRAAIAATFTSRSFMIFVMSNLFIQYVFTIVLAVMPFYAKYVLGVGAAETSLMLLSTFLVAMIMMFMWRIPAVRYGAKNTYLAAISFLALSLLPFFFVRSYTACLIATALVGIGLAGIILISDILISDVIDEDELRSGVRREGMFFGFNAFITRFAIGMEAASLGIVFILTAYDPHILIQSATYIFGLRLLIAGLPFLALAAAFLIMIFYPLSGQRFIEMKNELKALHDRKAGGQV